MPHGVPLLCFTALQFRTLGMAKNNCGHKVCGSSVETFVLVALKVNTLKDVAK